MFKNIMVVLCFLGPSTAFAECDPVNFLVDDITNVTLTDDVKTAFLQVATKDQYEKATQGGATSFGYGPYQGALNYDQAKTASNKETTLKRFTYNREYYVRYLTQKLSTVGADAYAKCLEQDRSSPGLRIWSSRIEGSFYFLKAFWVGRDGAKGLGAVVGDPVVKGFDPIQIPTEWPKGATQEILLQKLDDGDAVLSLKVSDEAAAFVAVREPPVILMANAKVSSPTLVSIGSGGSSDGKHPVNAPQQKEDCVYPSAQNRVLIPGSGHIADLLEVAAAGTTSAVLTANEPDRICFKFSSSTGDKMVRNTISGRVTAFERYVVSP
jgi:hypothetical protein